MERSNSSEESHTSRNDVQESDSSFSSSFSNWLSQPIAVEASESQQGLPDALVVASLGNSDLDVQSNQSLTAQLSPSPSYHHLGVTWLPFISNTEPATQDYPLEISSQETLQGRRGPSQMVVSHLSNFQNYQNGDIPFQRPQPQLPQHTERKNISQGTLSVPIFHMHHYTCVWKLTNVREKRKKACEGAECVHIQSPPFYYGRRGYKMCLRLYMNGDGLGKGTHLSVFLVMMQADRILEWPFNHKVTVSLIDQSKSRQQCHIVQSSRLDSTSSSFHQPLADMNIASGFPQFANLDTLTNNRYVVDDTIYIRVKIEMEGHWFN